MMLGDERGYKSEGLKQEINAPCYMCRERPAAGYAFGYVWLCEECWPAHPKGFIQGDPERRRLRHKLCPPPWPQLEEV